MSLRAAAAATVGLQRSRAANFDRVARIYRWAEYVALGPLLRLTRERYLAEIAGAREALVLGDGDGRFAAELLVRAPGMQVRAVDASAAMLRLLRERCERRGVGSRVGTLQASALEVDAGPEVDLVVTHFFLDCLTQAEVDQLTARLARQVKCGCLWVVSDFGLPRKRIARPLGAAYIRLLYVAFRLLTGLRTQSLPDPQRALRTAGFRLEQRSERMGGLLYSEFWKLEPGEEYNRVCAVNGATWSSKLTST